MQISVNCCILALFSVTLSKWGYMLPPFPKISPCIYNLTPHRSPLNHTGYVTGAGYLSRVEYIFSKYPHRSHKGHPKIFNRGGYVWSYCGLIAAYLFQKHAMQYRGKVNTAAGPVHCLYIIIAVGLGSCCEENIFFLRSFAGPI